MEDQKYESSQHLTYTVVIHNTFELQERLIYNHYTLLRNSFDCLQN
jgi:hypothetical protein